MERFLRATRVLLKSLFRTEVGTEPSLAFGLNSADRNELFYAGLIDDGLWEKYRDYPKLRGWND